MKKPPKSQRGQEKRRKRENRQAEEHEGALLHDSPPKPPAPARPPLVSGVCFRSINRSLEHRGQKKKKRKRKRKKKKEEEEEEENKESRGIRKDREIYEEGVSRHWRTCHRLRAAGEWAHRHRHRHLARRRRRHRHARQGRCVVGKEGLRFCFSSLPET